MKTQPILLALALMLFCSCASGAKKSGNAASLTDSRDGKKYKTAKIGEQTWMAENLNFDAKDSKCYKDKPENCEKYGKLYNYETAKTACPSGWHLPTKGEFSFLSGATGGSKVAGKNIRANKGWKIDGASSGDKFGFSALPAGFYSDKSGFFKAEGYETYWWAASDTEEIVFYYTSHLDANYYRLELMTHNGGMMFIHLVEKAVNTWEKHSAPYQSSLYSGTHNHYNIGKDGLLSIRCVKD
jgi:uncharacterized protein (TIGR02145 family)